MLIMRYTKTHSFANHLRLIFQPIFTCYNVNVRDKLLKFQIGQYNLYIFQSERNESVLWRK